MGIIDFIIVPLVSLVNFYFVFSIYSRKRRNNKDVAIANFILFATLWITSAFLSELTIYKLFFTKVAFFSVLIAVSFLIYASFLWLKRQNQKKTDLNKLVSPILILISLVLSAVLFFSDWIIIGIKLTSWGFDIIFGNLYYLFLGYLAFCTIIALINFAKSYFNAKGLEKDQLKYWFLGLVLFVFSSVFVNVVIRAIVNSDQYYRLGNYSIIFFTAFTAYAILRYRLMDIRLLVRRRILLPVILITVITIYALIFLYLNNRLTVYLPAITNYLYFAALLIGALIYDSVKDRISNFIDHFFLIAPYNREDIVGQLDNLLRQSADFNINNKLVIGALRVRMHLNKVIFVALDREIHNLAVEETSRGTVHEKRFVLPHIITNYLKKHKQTLVYEELKREIEDGILKETKLLKEIEKIKAYVLVPILINRQLTGILILGEKQSGDAFTVEDIKMLDDLAYRISRSMESSSLYRQIEKQKNQLSRNYGDLKKVMDITISRELKMAELKKKIKNNN